MKMKFKRFVILTLALSSAHLFSAPQEVIAPAIAAPTIQENFTNRTLNDLLEYVQNNETKKAQNVIANLVQTKDGKKDVSVFNKKDRFGKSIIDYMVIYGRKNLIDYLLAQESDNSKIDIENAQKIAKQKLEAKEKNSFEINALLNGGKTPKATFADAQVENVLNLIRQDNIKKALQAIKALSSEQLNAKDKQDKTLLMYAIIYGEKEVVQAVLDQDKSGLEAHDVRGNTPVILAATFGYPQIVELLFQEGAKFSNAAAKEAIDHILGQQGIVIPWLVFTPKFLKTKKVLTTKKKYEDYMNVLEAMVANPPSGTELVKFKTLLEQYAPMDQGINKINKKIEVQ